MRPCPSRRRELAELVDGALSVRDTERLNAHLVECSGCQDEVASLRRVREQLRIAGSSNVAPSELQDRLLSIAGPEADRPLYARPFDRSPTQTLPSRRRRAQRAVAGAVTVTCLMLAGLVGVGWAAAPPTRTPALDPGPMAREEFATMQAETPLSNPAVTAARARDVSRIKTERLVGPPAPTLQLTTQGALEALERAAAAPSRTTYAGSQIVQIRHLAGYGVTDVQVSGLRRLGTQVVLPGRDGVDRSLLIPDSSSEGVPALAVAHELRMGPAAPVAGREASVVEARQDGRAAARWWLDSETGLVLWQETLDERGEITMSAGYRTIEFGAVDAVRHLPPRLAAGGFTTNLALTKASVLARDGWQCDEHVAGLPLSRLRDDRRDGVLHAVYGDGIVTLSVFQQKGALAGAPTGFVWDPEMEVYRSLGLTTMYAWQSGNTVFTVATSGPGELAERAVAELPHDPAVLRTRVGRVFDGWRSLMGVGE